MLLKPEKVAAKLARMQLANPLIFIIISFIITIIAGVYGAGLGFDSTYEALLPEGAPELDNVDAIREKTGGTRQLVIAIGGRDPEKRLAFGRKLLPAIREIKGVRVADLEFPIDFFKDRGFWLLDVETLDQLIPTLEEAVQVSKNQANPLALHLDEEEEKKELEAAWKKVEDIVRNPEEEAPFDGVLTSEDGKYTFMLVIPAIKFTDIARCQTFLDDVQNAVDQAKPVSRGVTVRFAGVLEVLNEQHHIIREDMVKASILAMVFGILVVAFFTRRILAPFIVSVSLMPGIIWTIAMARVYVGHVNVITGFLFAVLVGLGIDFGIHLFVRYKQEIRQPGATVESSFINFVVGTAAPSVTAALTTAGVFFSFAVSDFRGFSEFGLIAGTGVLFTLVSTFVVLPPLVLLAYRNKPLPAPLNPTTLPDRTSGTIPMPFAVAVVGTMLIVALFGLYAGSKIPFKNDFRQLRGYSDATKFLDYVDRNLGAGFNPSVFVTKTLEDAAAVERALKKSMDRDAKKDRVAKIGKVISVGNLLPRNIEEHKPRIEKLKEILWDASLNRAVEEDNPQAKKLRDARRMIKTEPWKIDDVPYTFRRRFTTVDKDNPEYLVYAWSAAAHDADYKAEAWEKTLEEVSSSLDKQGVKHDMADETLILSWVFKLVRSEAAPLLIIAAVIVFLFLVIDFRNPKDVLLLALPLSVGMLVFMSVAYLVKMEINMFNMVVIPSVIGIGIDNAVHILHRYHKEGTGSLLFVFKNTGMAALLASITTAVGFGATIIAHSEGLRSMGIMAVIGILSTFVAAIVFLPCVLAIIEKIKSPK